MAKFSKLQVDVTAYPALLRAVKKVLLEGQERIEQTICRVGA